jgi:hypothetical protein
MLETSTLSICSVLVEGKGTAVLSVSSLPFLHFRPLFVTFAYFLTMCDKESAPLPVPPPLPQYVEQLIPFTPVDPAIKRIPIEELFLHHNVYSITQYMQYHPHLSPFKMQACVHQVQKQRGIQDLMTAFELCYNHDFELTRILTLRILQEDEEEYQETISAHSQSIERSLPVRSTPLLCYTSSSAPACIRSNNFHLSAPDAPVPSHPSLDWCYLSQFPISMSFDFSLYKTAYQWSVCVLDTSEGHQLVSIDIPVAFFKRFAHATVATSSCAIHAWNSFISALCAYPVQTTLTHAGHAWNDIQQRFQHTRTTPCALYESLTIPVQYNSDQLEQWCKGRAMHDSASNWFSFRIPVRTGTPYYYTPQLATIHPEVSRFPTSGGVLFMSHRTPQVLRQCLQGGGVGGGQPPLQHLLFTTSVHCASVHRTLQFMYPAMQLLTNEDACDGMSRERVACCRIFTYEYLQSQHSVRLRNLPSSSADASWCILYHFPVRCDGGTMKLVHNLVDTLRPASTWYILSPIELPDIKPFFELCLLLWYDRHPLLRPKEMLPYLEDIEALFMPLTMEYTYTKRVRRTLLWCLDFFRWMCTVVAYNSPNAPAEEALMTYTNILSYLRTPPPTIETQVYSISIRNSWNLEEVSYHLLHSLQSAFSKLETDEERLSFLTTKHVQDALAWYSYGAAYLDKLKPSPPHDPVLFERFISTFPTPHPSRTAADALYADMHVYVCDDRCSICQESFDMQQTKTVALVCGHRFHDACVMQYAHCVAEQDDSDRMMEVEQGQEESEFQRVSDSEFADYHQTKVRILQYGKDRDGISYRNLSCPMCKTRVPCKRLPLERTSLLVQEYETIAPSPDPGTPVIHVPITMHPTLGAKTICNRSKDAYIAKFVHSAMHAPCNEKGYVFAISTGHTSVYKHILLFIRQRFPTVSIHALYGEDGLQVDPGIVNVLEQRGFTTDRHEIVVCMHNTYISYIHCPLRALLLLDVPMLPWTIPKLIHQQWNLVHVIPSIHLLQIENTLEQALYEIHQETLAAFNPTHSHTYQRFTRRQQSFTSVDSSTPLHYTLAQIKRTCSPL